ncbi:MAG: hypothetical protein IJP36_06415 [Bacteroides sp.]|nr:hypothetical protein [Bacteroides sp.]
MKTTSKIIIGLLVAIPLLIFIFAILCTNVFVLSEEDRNYYVNNGQLTTIELPACKAIEFRIGVVEYIMVSEGRYMATDLFSFHEGGELKVTPTTEAHASFTITEALKSHTAISMHGDTCVVTFSFPRAELPERYGRVGLLNVITGDMQLTLPKDVVYVDDSVLNLFICQGLSHERLTFNTNARIDMYDSNIDTLNVQFSRLLQLKSGHVKHLFVDADRVNWQQFYNAAFVDVEHISGTRNVRRHVTSDSNRIVWEPKSDHARLELVLAGPMEVEVSKPSE